MTAHATTVVFDLGGVVVDWDPVPAVAVAVGHDRAERFVHGDGFDFAAWNHAQDAGRPWVDAVSAATASHPELAEEIAGYLPNFVHSLRGLVPGTAEVLRGLDHHGVRLVALSNWSGETIHHALEAYPEVFALFSDIVVSGAEGIAKPDPRIFQVLECRLGHSIAGVFYVDDNGRNVDVARRAEMDAVRFTDAGTLRQDLQARGILD